MSIVLAITTDGRGEYLERTIDSIEAKVTGDIARRCLWDDSGDRDYRRWLLESFVPRGYVVGWPGDTPNDHRRVGHAWARWALWTHLAAMDDVTHVAGWEDDFVLTRPVDLDDMVRILDANPHLSQLALMRNRCYPRELRTPDRILGWPRGRFRQQRGYFQHRLFWTCNPSVYRLSLCAEGWPVVEGSENRFHEMQVAKHRWSAFYGRMDDPPAIEHIGAERAGGWY